MNKFIKILGGSVYFVLFLLTILIITRFVYTGDYNISEICIFILTAILTLSASIYYYNE